MHLEYVKGSTTVKKLQEDKPSNDQKFNELISYNMDTDFQDLESDLKNLDAMMKRKNAMDKRNKVIYGGHGVFPSQDKMDKLGNIGKFKPQKQVNF